MPIIKHIPIYSALKKLLSYAANEKKMLLMIPTFILYKE